MQEGKRGCESQALKRKFKYPKSGCVTWCHLGTSGSQRSQDQAGSGQEIFFPLFSPPPWLWDALQTCPLGVAQTTSSQAAGANSPPASPTLPVGDLSPEQGRSTRGHKEDGAGFPSPGPRAAATPRHGLVLGSPSLSLSLFAAKTPKRGMVWAAFMPAPSPLQGQGRSIL